MKRCLTLLSVIIGISAYGQTNTFPASGNVGIGTTSPFSKLSVVIPVSTSNTGGDPNAYGASFSDNNTSTLAIRSLGNGIIHLATDGSGRKLILGGGNFEQTLSINAGNNVGIGTINPTNKFQIKAQGNEGDLIRITANTGAHSVIEYFSDDYATYAAYSGLVNMSNWNGLQYPFIIQTNGRPISITTTLNSPTSGLTLVNGMVGIGTATPKEALSVNGHIRAIDIKVEAGNWPDYVFQLEHQLPSLESLAMQIRTQGHLPNIPSAEEVSKNGIALGEMNQKLLEKIEELTLYTIKQNEKLKQQDEQIKIESKDVKQLKELLLKQSEQLSKQQQEIESLKSRIK